MLDINLQFVLDAEEFVACGLRETVCRHQLIVMIHFNTCVEIAVFDWNLKSQSYALVLVRLDARILLESNDLSVIEDSPFYLTLIIGTIEFDHANQLHLQVFDILLAP